MSTLHPHWHTTDEDERPVRITDASVRAPAPVHAARPAVPRAKRGPAAFVGIALFIGVGFALFQGVNGLLGQVGTGDEVIVRMTDAGVDPETVTVKPGETIRWENQGSIPHILESETLPTEDDKSFITTAIFPSGSFDYTVPAGAAAGEHDYASKTAVSVKGRIVIESAGAGGVAASSAHSDSPVIPPVAAPVQNTPPAAGSIEYTPPAQTAIPAPAQNDAGESTMTGIIPQNPNTIASGNVPLPPRQQPGVNVPAARTQGNVMQHMPSATTETGMEAWVTLAIAGVSLIYVVRKATADF